MFTALGRWCARRPKRVVAAWLLLVAALVMAVGVLGRATTEAVSIPGSDSQAAHDVAARAFPGSASGKQPLVLHTGGTGALLTSPNATTAIQQAAKAMAQVPHVVAVTTPYDSAGKGSISSDGHTAYLSVELDVTGRDITADLTNRVVAAAAPASAAGIEVTPGGNLAAAVDKGSVGHSEAIGLAAAFAVLVLTFGGLVAAGLPLLLGVLGLGISLPVVGLLGHLMDMPSAGETIAAMIGLGVGIDYTLFCLTRFRELPATGAGVEDAAVRTTAGSGKSVAFAGSAVIAALAALALGGLPLLYALALAPGVAVLAALAVNLTLLPALLTLLGRRLAPKKPRATTDRPSGWGRIAELVAAKPWPLLLAGLTLLGALAVPATRLTFGQLDAGNNAAGTVSRTAYDQLATAFGPGTNGTLLITDSLPTAAADPSDPRITTVTQALHATSGVAALGAPQLSSDGRTVRWQLTPTTAPTDPATSALVHRLREQTLPLVTVGSTHVGGAPAAQADLNDRIARRMPLVVGFVLLVAGLLLLLAFRSPIVAAKAAVMNLVSVAAAYGVLTAVFQ
ncbi:RND superfamily putative drug exporter [Kitasatospora sp. MAP5-34]|nr:RND superfamily putative drug exporter [Kitasatospora sp. MAP5-34]